MCKIASNYALFSRLPITVVRKIIINIEVIKMVMADKPTELCLEIDLDENDDINSDKIKKRNM